MRKYMPVGREPVRATYRRRPPPPSRLLPGFCRLDAAPQPLRRTMGGIGPNTQEAGMGKAIPQQHPAVVLRSHYRQLQAMLAIAMVAVVGLSGAVVVVASDDDEPVAPSSAVQFQESPATHAHPKEQPNSLQPAGTRYDGGPEEGTRGVVPSRNEGLRHPGAGTD
jgi:hypothetical protein